jgi:hypothetical protein
MHKENVAFVHSGILFNLEKEGNPVICDNMEEPGEQYSKRNKSGTEGQILHEWYHAGDESKVMKWWKLRVACRP